MGTISVSLPSDGQTADASDYNTPINTIVNEFNGNIDNANIKTGAAIAGSKLASASVTATQIDFGGAGVGVWFEEIARTTLSVAGDTISVTSIPARKHLRIVVLLINSGQIDATMRFNNDSGANYSQQGSSNFGAGADITSATSQAMDAGTPSAVGYHTLEIMNVATSVKIGIFRTVDAVDTSAATAPDSRTSFWKWANTSDQISRVDVLNAGTGDFAIGSEVIVLGHD